ncbi:MAG TPA: YaiI/YqxD family protein [Gammaproteobacteria bacterium]|nr:YaiI/YqxD family protein [Gammaproteobacteria bacterium]
MHIWVDADACPKAIKQVLFKAAERLAVPLTLVANQYIPTPPSRVIKSVQVAQGFDVADDAIVERVADGDLVITADIPLAADVVAKGGTALNPRGTHYTSENIKDYVQRRNRAEEMRAAGVIGSGPTALDKKDVQAFANALDRILARSVKR